MSSNLGWMKSEDNFRFWLVFFMSECATVWIAMGKSLWFVAVWHQTIGLREVLCFVTTTELGMVPKIYMLWGCTFWTSNLWIRQDLRQQQGYAHENHVGRLWMHTIESLVFKKTLKKLSPWNSKIGHDFCRLLKCLAQCAAELTCQQLCKGPIGSRKDVPSRCSSCTV